MRRKIVSTQFSTTCNKTVQHWGTFKIDSCSHSDQKSPENAVLRKDAIKDMFELRWASNDNEIFLKNFEKQTLSANPDPLK